MFSTLNLDVININRDGYALGEILWFVKMDCMIQIGYLFRSILVTPTILTITIVNPLAP
jgi:hypothetical protein